MKLETIYIFGDSLHDNGNLLKATSGKLPSPLYFKGRFSNGPLYCEYLQERLSKSTGRKIALKNYAHAGALTNYINGYLPEAISLHEQISSHGRSFTDKDLIIIGCGPNNCAFFFDIYQFPYLHIKRVTSIALDLRNSARKLIRAGAKNIIMFNVPNIFSAPVSRKVTMAFRLIGVPAIKKSLAKTNKDIRAYASELSKGDVKVCVFDVHSLLAQAIHSPDAFGFNNSTSSIIPGAGKYTGEINISSSEEDYLFWDYVHPTTKAHNVLSEHISLLINKNFCIE